MRAPSELILAPSHLKSMARFIANRLQVRMGGGGDGPPVQRPVFRARALVANTAALRRYLRATDGDRIQPLLEARALPPIYSAVWETSFYLDILRVSGFPLPEGGLIHVGGERIFLRDARTSDTFDFVVRVTEIATVSSGRRLTLATQLWTSAGHLCMEGRTFLLLREAPTGPRIRSPEVVRAPSAPEWERVASWDLSATHGLRYAAVSGDFNPIHLTRRTAKLYRFDGPILHGFCCEGMVAHALIEHRLGGVPEALRRLSIEFRRAVRLPCRAELLVAWREDGGGGWFRLMNADRGLTPFAAGEFVGRAADQG